MFLCHGNDKIKVKYFNGVILDIRGNVVTAYSVIVPNEINGCQLVLTTSNSSIRDTIKIVNHGLDIGDSISLIDNSGLEFRTYVTEVGTDVIKIEDKIIKNKFGNTFTLKKDFYTITFNNIPNGFYKFNTNEAIIVSDNYINLYVTYSELNTYQSAIPQSTVMEKLNIVARDSVIADFSMATDFYKYVDVAQIKELIIRKMLVLIAVDINNRKFYQDDYEKYYEKVFLIIKGRNDGSTHPDPTDENIINDFNGGERFRIRVGVI